MRFNALTQRMGKTQLPLAAQLPRVSREAAGEQLLVCLCVCVRERERERKSMPKCLEKRELDQCYEHARLRYSKPCKNLTTNYWDQKKMLTAQRNHAKLLHFGTTLAPDHPNRAIVFFSFYSTCQFSQDVHCYCVNSLNIGLPL